MGAYAEALDRDRWRVHKCEERLRVVNLGGTAIGSGFAAPRQYVFRVVDVLRELSGIGFVRAENLTDATQNADVLVEVSGVLKAHAVTLLKIAGDLRLMSSGTDAGLGEIRLPRRQGGSAAVPGRIDPVIPEAVSQVALYVFGCDATIAVAAGSGSLELNAFLPLVADRLLESLRLLAHADETLRRLCVEGLEADEERCAAQVHASAAAATALVPEIGDEAARDIARRARERGATVREVVLADGVLTADRYDELLTAEAVCRLGTPGMGSRGAQD
jgi:aspartate ammonia-lyase